MFGFAARPRTDPSLEAFLASGAGLSCSLAAVRGARTISNVLGLSPGPVPIEDQVDALRGLASAAAEAAIELACEACELKYDESRLQQMDLDGRDWHECLWQMLDQQGQHELERRTGLTFMGIGAFRVVLKLCDGLVLKVAVCPDFASANVQEMDVWVDANTVTRQLIVPTVELGLGGQWLIMEEATASMDKHTDMSARRGRALELHRVARDLAQSTDLDWYNWGWHDGQLKLLDYGNG